MLKLLLSILFMISYSNADVPKLSDFVKDSDGTYMSMQYSSEYLRARYPSYPKWFPPDFIGAREYCDKLGKRLPTTRELALFATTLGAKGILELNVVKKSMGGIPPNGYEFVSSTNSDGVRDDFYFSSEGFKPLPSNLRPDHSWSSSFLHKDAITVIRQFRHYYGDFAGGYIGIHNAGTYSASFACVVGKTSPWPPITPVPTPIPR